MNDRFYKHTLVEKHGAVCWYCGLDIPDVKQRSVDHVVALSKLARMETPPAKREVALACHICNSAKASRTVEEFNAWLRHVRSDSFKSYMGYENISLLSSVLIKLSTALSKLGLFNIL